MLGLMIIHTLGELRLQYFEGEKPDQITGIVIECSRDEVSRIAREIGLGKPVTLVANIDKTP
jgi:hypothetical protein